MLSIMGPRYDSPSRQFLAVLSNVMDIAEYSCCVTHHGAGEVWERESEAPSICTACAGSALIFITMVIEAGTTT